MKLLRCLECGDIFNLSDKKKVCTCTKSWGMYVDNLNAEISGPCMPIGFDNNSFADAMRMQRIENKIVEKYAKYKEEICCKGRDFNAFFIPDHAKSIKRI